MMKTKGQMTTMRRLRAIIIGAILLGPPLIGLAQDGSKTQTELATQHNTTPQNEPVTQDMPVSQPSGLLTGKPVENDLSKPTHSPEPHQAAIVPIHGEINDVTFKSLTRRVESARAEGATLIVFEMDTPGGMVSSALDICQFIKNLTDIKTVAWVNQDAYSAGAMISLACNEVVMAAASRIGDCAPIIISMDGLQELGETERAKAESPILKEFDDSALRNGYNRLLCESMVRLGHEIWWLENNQTAEKRFVLKEDKESLLAEDDTPWFVIKKMKDATTGKLVDLRQPVVKERDLLTLTQSEAVAFGFAKAIISTQAEMRTRYNITGSLPRLDTNWAEAIADFLSSPMVRLVLIVLIALGAYAEFQAPGHMIGGSVAAVALLIFLGAPYLVGLADVWEILLVVIGIVLLGVEIFVIPGFGIAGIAGLMLLFLGLIATFVPADPGPIIVPRLTPGTMLGLRTGASVLFGGLALSLAGMWVLNRYLPRVPGARGLFLPPAPAINPAVSGLASIEAPKLAGATVSPGDSGKTLTQLRPAGKAQINGRRVDVIAQGQVIDEGSTVEVVEVEGARVVVREVRKA